MQHLCIVAGEKGRSDQGELCGMTSVKSEKQEASSRGQTWFAPGTFYRMRPRVLF